MYALCLVVREVEETVAGLDGAGVPWASKRADLVVVLVKEDYVDPARAGRDLDE